MIEALNSSIYNKRYLRQFEIPIGRDKRRSSIVKKKPQQQQLSGGSEIGAGACTNYDTSRMSCWGSSVDGSPIVVQNAVEKTAKIDVLSLNFAKNLGIQARRRFSCFGIKSSSPQIQGAAVCEQIPVDVVEDLELLLKNDQPLVLLPGSLREPSSECMMDKVDGAMRDNAVFNLLFLHKGFYDLSAATFSRAVHIVDHFLMRVKVKPKYMACVSTAAYLIATRHYESQTPPSTEDLVNLTHCGGTEDDLSRMAMIIRTKLQQFMWGTTALDYLQLFGALAGRLEEAENAATAVTASPILSGEARQRVGNRILFSLTSFEIRQFSPACLALAALCLEWSEVEDALLSRLLMLHKLAGICQVPWQEVIRCSGQVQHLYEQCYATALPSSRGHLFWCLSRRTRIGLSLMRERRQHIALRLDSISEAEDSDDDVSDADADDDEKEARRPHAPEEGRGGEDSIDMAAGKA